MVKFYRKRRFIRRSRYRPSYRRKKYGFKKYSRYNRSKKFNSYRKRRFYKSKRTVHNKKFKYYKSTMLLSGAEILKESMIINSFWQLYVYDLSSVTSSMLARLRQNSSATKNLFLDEPEWVSIRLFHQDRTTPLYYPFLCDNISSDAIQKCIIKDGFNGFLSKYGIRTRPRAVSLIQGKKNDSCFSYKNLNLYVLQPGSYVAHMDTTYKIPALPADISRIPLKGEKVVPTQTVDSVDLFDYKLTIGCKTFYDSCAIQVKFTGDTVSELLSNFLKGLGLLSVGAEVKKKIEEAATKGKPTTDNPQNYSTFYNYLYDLLRFMGPGIAMSAMSNLYSILVFNRMMLNMLVLYLVFLNFLILVLMHFLILTIV